MLSPYYSGRYRRLMRTSVLLVAIVVMVLLIVLGMGGTAPVTNPVHTLVDVAPATYPTVAPMVGASEKASSGTRNDGALPTITTACLVGPIHKEGTAACEVALTNLQKRGLSHQATASVHLDKVTSGGGPSRQQLLKETVCTPFRDLPPGPDGLGLFNIALSPIQIPLSEVWTTRDTNFPVLASNVGGRPGTVVPNYQIIPPVGVYGFSHKDVSITPPPPSKAVPPPSPPTAPFPSSLRPTLTLEVFGAIGRWCNYRSSFGLRGAMMLSVNYLGYVSVVATQYHSDATPYTKSSSSSSSDRSDKWRHDVRWHEMGMVPFPANSTMVALSSFQRHNFPQVTGKKALGRGGLEDCLYFVTTREDGSKRHFITANIGFNFGAGQMFIGEITSRMLNTKASRIPPAAAASKSPNITHQGVYDVDDASVMFDYEVVPFVEDPEGFGLKLGDKGYNANRTFEKNWNIIPCDWDAIFLQTSSSSQSDASLRLLQQPRERGDIICFLTNVAPKVIVYAFDMLSKKVVARWQHNNPKSTSKIYRGGKGAVGIHLVGGGVGNTKGEFKENERSEGGGALLTLVHEKLRGGYRLEWMMLNSSAPFNLIRPYLQKHPNSQTKKEVKHINNPDGDGGGAIGRGREGHFKLAKVPVEYVRSITASQDRTHIYFGHSTHDARGQFCVVPLLTAASAAVHGLS